MEGRDIPPIGRATPPPPPPRPPPPPPPPPPPRPPWARAAESPSIISTAARAEMNRRLDMEVAPGERRGGRFVRRGGVSGHAIGRSVARRGPGDDEHRTDADRVSGPPAVA